MVNLFESNDDNPSEDDLMQSILRNPDLQQYKFGLDQQQQQQQLMTHDTPELDAPYMHPNVPVAADYISRYASGQGPELLEEATGIQLPQWVKTARDVVNNPDVNSAIGATLPIGKLNELLQAGKTYAQIADELGVTRNVVAGNIRDLNLKGLGNKPQRISQEDIDLMKELRGLGNSTADVGAKMGVNPNTMTQRVFRYIGSDAPKKIRTLPPEALAEMTPGERRWLTRTQDAQVANNAERIDAFTRGAMKRAADSESDPVLREIGLREHEMYTERAAMRKPEKPSASRNVRQPSMPQIKTPAPENLDPADVAEFMKVFGYK